MLIGLFLIVTSGIGLIRMPDVFNRLHATTKSATLGQVSVLLATMVHFAGHGPTVWIKLLAVIAFLYLSSPVGAHMIAKAAYLTGDPLSERTARDDLHARYGSVEGQE